MRESVLSGVYCELASPYWPKWSPTYLLTFLKKKKFKFIFYINLHNFYYFSNYVSCRQDNGRGEISDSVSFLQGLFAVGFICTR